MVRIVHVVVALFQVLMRKDETPDAVPRSIPTSLLEIHELLLLVADLCS
jgi:hypothetical protein